MSEEEVIAELIIKTLKKDFGSEPLSYLTIRKSIIKALSKDKVNERVK